MMLFVPWNRPRTGLQAALRELSSEDSGRAMQALDTLYRAEAAQVYRYALGLCGNPTWAADATQEAFVALALRPQGFDPAKGSLGAYLAGMARHMLAAHWRESRQALPWPETEDGGAQPDEPLHELTPEAVLVPHQGSDAIWAALRQLTPAFREVLILVDLQDRPYAEAAAIAGVELNTLRTRLHRGRSKLAALLGAPARSKP